MSKPHQNQPTMPEEWRAGLCDSCYVSCCAPCAMGEIAQWTDRSCCLWTIYSCLLPCCATTHLRGIVRERQDIPGDCCTDCLASLFCCPCATQQLYTENRSSVYEERKKQKRMEDMLEEQHEQQRLSPPPQPPMSPMAPATTTVVFAAAPSPAPMTMAYHHPQAVYPMPPPAMPVTYAPPPSPSAAGGKDGGYYTPNGKPAY